MYRAWEKKCKKYSKETKAFARNLETKFKKVKDKEELRKLHKEWCDFIDVHDELILESHWNLVVFWDKKVGFK